MESLRTAAVEFTHQEGYNRSEQDVTIQRVVAALSSPLKRAFADFSTAPFVARALFGEVQQKVDEDLYYTLDYDGNFTVSRKFAVVTGTESVLDAIRERMADFKPKTAPDKAIEQLKEIWAASLDPENEEDDKAQVGDLKPEAMLLERGAERENRFRLLTPEEF